MEMTSLRGSIKTHTFQLQCSSRHCTRCCAFTPVSSQPRRDSNNQAPPSFPCSLRFNLQHPQRYHYIADSSYMVSKGLAAVRFSLSTPKTPPLHADLPDAPPGRFASVMLLSSSSPLASQLQLSTVNDCPCTAKVSPCWVQPLVH